jgi:hypothetical protein
MGCNIKRIIRLTDAIQTTPIQIIDNGVDRTNQCLFSWSNDGVCWTGWSSYSEYLRITQYIDTDFYVRILVNCNVSSVVLNNCATTEYTICIDSSTTFVQDFCGETNLFQPYNNLDCALNLQQQLADSVVCMFGVPIYYFRCDPKPESIDYTFKEYVLRDVVAVKQLKLMIKDGSMPSSNPKLTEFDFDWETDWETEISKTQFATAFGDKIIPKYGDFIYIPMMQRMWDVNAAYDEKNEGLMWRSTTWKLQLVKYADSTAYDGNGFDDIIDTFAPKTYENTFGWVEELEQERETQSLQASSPMFAATNLHDIFMEDAIRKQYTKNDAVIIDKQYAHRANIVSRNMYRFHNENGCITYQNGICGDDGTVMFIVETPGSLSEIERDILQFGNLRVTMRFADKKLSLITNSGLCATLEPFKSYMCIIRWNRGNFIVSMDIYNYTHRQDIPLYKLRPEMYWFDFENPVYSEIKEYDNNLIARTPMPCQVHAYPLQMANIKYYNEYLDDETAIKESIKYTTDNDFCVFNDTVRPINSGHGYAIQ